MERDLSQFCSNRNLKETIGLTLWATSNLILFERSYFPRFFRVSLLKLFGAKIGKGVVIRSGVKIHAPWNLDIGNNCWIGQQSWFINHMMITIGDNVCISQKSIICSSGHDLLSLSLIYKHKPIHIGDGAWICLGAIVLPGSVIGKNSVVSAGEVFSGELPGSHLYARSTIKAIQDLH